MKKKSLLTLAVITLFSLTGGVFAQNKKPVSGEVKTGSASAAAPAAPSVQTDFFGAFEANTYKNKFFGVKITVPEKWVVQESEVNKAIKQIGSEAVKGKNEVSEKALDDAMQRLTVLFTASRDILGMRNNAVMIFSAEKAPPLVPFRNGEDYLRLNLQSFKKLQLPPDFKYSETLVAEKLGNETFYYLEIQRTGYKQRMYATARKGYALFFTVSYIDDEDLEAIRNTLRNSDFSWKE
jgi:hypothetical protein